jgi:hypothetical protein
MKPVIAVLAAALLAAGAISASGPASAPQTPEASGQRSFEGTLSATGQRQSVPTESGRPAVTLQLSGPVAITAGEGLRRAFRSEVVGFEDGAGLTVLRGVWSDDHGDRIFSALRGETIASGRRITATITGGTGRYAGITGEYSFEWRYVVEAEAGTISGRAIGLRGRYRLAGGGK